jgi:methylenetetrahydrofolate dehydrogenase (NADP+) / methenyltetrahydrofolate cyclohydrolase
VSARILDGKMLAAGLRARVASEVGALKSAHGIVPGLAVIFAGDDAASTIYIRAKSAAAHEVGFRAFDLKFPAGISERDLVAEISRLNAESSVHGILVQLPLPERIAAGRVIDAVDPLKDVDGLTALNAGRLAIGEFGARRGLVACTPSGCLRLIEHALGAELAGREALVIGRSNLVGKPMAQLLLQKDCTVTLAHTKTRDVAGLARRADILIAAAGRAEMVRGDWIKPGAVVVDVGVNRRMADGQAKLIGDVAFDEAKESAGWITPVSGGAGPMTIASLMRNTLIAATLQAGLPHPNI